MSCWLPAEAGGVEGVGELVPRTASTESSVSVPTVAASPVTVPAARLTVMPESSPDRVVVGAVEAAAAVDGVVAGAAGEHLDRAEALLLPSNVSSNPEPDDARKPRTDKVSVPDRRIAGRACARCRSTVTPAVALT